MAPGVPVVEDAAQAIGAAWRPPRGEQTGCGAIGDAAAFSFFPTKNLGGWGDGGMVTTDDAELWKSMWAYKDHGKDWDAVNDPRFQPGFRWLHAEFGTNWRLTEMQSAIGRVQLTRMPQWHARRLQGSTKHRPIGIPSWCPMLLKHGSPRVSARKTGRL